LWGFVKDWMQAILYAGIEGEEPLVGIVENLHTVMDLLKNRLRDPRLLPSQGLRSRRATTQGDSYQQGGKLQQMREKLWRVEQQMMEMMRERRQGDQTRREMMREITRMQSRKKEEGEEIQNLRDYVQELESARLAQVLKGRDKMVQQEIREAEEDIQQEPVTMATQDRIRDNQKQQEIREVEEGMQQKPAEQTTQEGSPAGRQERSTRTSTEGSPWGLTPAQVKKRRTQGPTTGDISSDSSEDSEGPTVGPESPGEGIELAIEAVKGEKRDKYLAAQHRALQIIRVKRIQMQVDQERDLIRAMEASKTGSEDQGLSTAGKSRQEKQGEEDQGIKTGSRQADRKLGLPGKIRKKTEVQKEEGIEVAMVRKAGDPGHSTQGGTKGQPEVEIMKEEMQELHEQWDKLLGEIRVIKQQTQEEYGKLQGREQVRGAGGESVTRTTWHRTRSEGPGKEREWKVYEEKEGQQGRDKGGQGPEGTAQGRNWKVYEETENQRVGNRDRGDWRGGGERRRGDYPPLSRQTGPRGPREEERGRYNRYREEDKDTATAGRQENRGRVQQGGIKRSRANSTADLPSRREMGLWQGRGRDPPQQVHPARTR